VILQECAPSLRRRLATAHHVFAHAALPAVDAEFEQLTVDAGRAPTGILSAHFADQIADLTGLFLAKTLRVRRINDLGRTCQAYFSLEFPDVCVPSTSARLGCLRLSLPRRTHLGEPRPSATTADSARQATASSTESRRQAVLGRSARNLDWLEEIVDHCHPGDRGSLASGWVSVVLELAFSNSAYWRKKTIDQGTSRFDFSECGYLPYSCGGNCSHARSRH